jgi:hypothetical protein
MYDPQLLLSLQAVQKVRLSPAVKTNAGIERIPAFVPILFLAIYEPDTIASTGHISAHAPQSVQSLLSIEYFSSPSEIASTGHSPSQLPQAMHSSVIV